MKPLIIALAVARALDAASTCSALTHAGTAEGNPFFPSNCKAAIAVSSTVTVAQSFALTRLAVRHPVLSKVIAAASLSLESFAVVHNVRIR